MKRNTLQPPKVTASSGPAKKLAVIEYYLPLTKNIGETLSVLQHLGVAERYYQDLFCGYIGFVRGELRSREGSVSVICPSVNVSLKEIDGKVQVCIDRKPFEDFIRQEFKRQEEQAKETSMSTREELVAGIIELRKEVMRLSVELKTAHDLNESLLKMSEVKSRLGI